MGIQDFLGNSVTVTRLRESFGAKQCRLLQKKGGTVIPTHNSSQWTAF
jgi:hypothetical protein